MVGSQGRPPRTCADVRDRLSRLIDDDLAARDAAEVEHHVAGCAACVEELDGLLRAEEALLGVDLVAPSTVGEVAVSSALIERTVTAAVAATADGASAPAPSVSIPAPVAAASPARPARGSSSWIAAVAVAAAVVLALLAALSAGVGGASGRRSIARTSTGSDAPETVTAVTGAETVTRSTDPIVTAAGSPQAETATGMSGVLAPFPAGEGAAATATIVAGSAIDTDAVRTELAVHTALVDPVARGIAELRDDDPGANLALFRTATLASASRLDERTEMLLYAAREPETRAYLERVRLLVAELDAVEGADDVDPAVVLRLRSAVAQGELLESLAQTRAGLAGTEAAAIESLGLMAEADDSDARDVAHLALGQALAEREPEAAALHYFVVLGNGPGWPRANDAAAGFVQTVTRVGPIVRIDGVTPIESIAPADLAASLGAARLVEVEAVAPAPSVFYFRIVEEADEAELRAAGAQIERGRTRAARLRVDRAAAPGVLGRLLRETAPDEGR